MTTMRSVEVSVVRQALVSGQVIDGLTGQGLRGAFSVDISLKLAGSSQFKPFAATPRILPGGYFVLSGNPVDILPARLAPADSVEIRIAVSAPGYAAAEEVVVVDGASITPSPVAVDIAEQTYQLALIDAPVLQSLITLLPVAVGISGIVVDDNDLDSPVVGASVQVIAPDVLAAVISDSNGRYRIENLPIVESVTVRAELGSEASSVEHFVDYTTPLNFQIISLNG